ncbi:DUF3781 domain-containing protein [Furfurilactobacillus milii]|nr:DUF3781 domain-containing protein [Furfurilactobacillus milii]
MSTASELVDRKTLIHSTTLGVGRIKRNLGLTIPDKDVVDWCVWDFC